ncbi:MAG: diaminopimelate decarboxylase [Cyclobacteriaceae bacterium]|nr:diaminopimelate decarboxylase [Cyclobacteriaceae bacterium]
MELKNKKFRMQGVDLLDVAKEFGTPLYVYDADSIKSQYDKLINAFPNTKIKLKYAAKALTNISILKYLHSIGSGLDAVSIQEVELGMMAGFKADEIMYTPNGVSFEEIVEGVDKGVMLNIDNISILEQFGNKYQGAVPVCIRINPHLMAGGNHKISTGHIDSKFGISILQTRHLLRVIATYKINVVGIHMHTGSDILDAAVFLNGAELLFDVAKELKTIEFIDFGSGFKVPYHESDVEVDVADLGEKISKAFNDFCAEYGRELQLWFEPGKYLVSQSGVLLAKTNVVKTTPATVFAGVDSGLNHLIRPMMYDAYHDIVNISNTEGIMRVYTIVGYICETDTFGWDRKLNEISTGDILAIKNAGAYGYSMSSNYNSRFRPAEVLIINGEAKLIRKRETMEDLTRNQVTLDI